MGTDVSISRITDNELYIQLLPRATQRAFQLAKTFQFLSRSPWYLAGGTALALQVGHRQSVDLDFFIPRTDFDISQLERHLLKTNQWDTSYRQEGTLYGTLLKAKMSFIAYPFFKPTRDRVAIGHIRMLTPKDVAAMKIIAISQRGRKRDFVDLYWYCTHQEPLLNVLLNSLQQYPGQENNLNHILNSLVYFEDAEEDPMPSIKFQVEWKQVEKFFMRK